MAAVLLVVHPRRPAATGSARTATAWLTERGHTVTTADDDNAAATANATAAVPPDLALALGGDGTVLRAFRLVAAAGVPILGVNLGRLGYLAPVEPPEFPSALQRFLAGDAVVEDRMMLAVTIFRGPVAEGRPQLALNEAVVEKPRPGNTVRLSVTVGSRPWTAYAGDGMIVATPTGSTAYSFSARGPVLSPRMRAMLLTPVSPHMAFDRSLVVDATEAVRVEVTDERPAALTLDGRDRGLLRHGDAIVCTAPSPAARFVTFGDAGRDFYGILKSKFHVAER